MESLGLRFRLPSSLRTGPKKSQNLNGRPNTIPWAKHFEVLPSALTGLGAFRAQAFRVAGVRL